MTVGGLGPFCLPIGSEGEEQCLLLHRDPDEQWQLKRLAVTGPDQTQIQAVATLEGRLPEESLVSITVGDANGDGLPDLLFEWYLMYSGDRLEIYLGRGGGRFDRGETLFAEGNGNFRYLVFGDFDGDGADELALVQSPGHYFINTYKYRQGKGFVPWRRTFTSYPKSLAAMDVNGDRIDDLVHLGYLWPLSIVVHFGDREHALWFSDRQIAPVRAQRVSPLADAGDGSAEIVVFAAQLYPAEPTRIAAHAFSWDSGSWAPSWFQVMPEELDWPPDRRDIDHDGLEDFIFQNGSYSGHPTGGFQIMLTRRGAPLETGHRSRGEPTLIGSQDLDADGIPDALVMSTGRTISRYPGRAEGGFDEKRTIWASPFRTIYSRRSGDLDGDGLEDLVVAVNDPNHFEWWRSLGTGGFEVRPLTQLPGGLRTFDLIDLNADGQLDIVRSSFNEELGWHLFVAWGEGGGQLSTWRLALSGYLLTERAFVDLDGDGDLDLVSREDPEDDNGSDLSSFLLEEGSFRLLDSYIIPPFTSGRRSISLVTGDFDGDGLEDVIHYAQHPEERNGGVPVWRRSLGDGHLADPAPIFDGYLPWFPRFFASDHDRDGDADLIVIGSCSSGGRRVKVLGNDRGTLRVFWEGPESNDCPWVTLADLDSDGFLDLLETARSTSFRVWRADGGGAFSETLGPFFVGNWYGNFSNAAAVMGGAGLDHISIDTYPVAGVLTLPQSTETLEKDIAPPQVELLLWPEIDVFAGIKPFKNIWRVSGRITDECGVASITRVLAQTPPIDPASPNHFKPAPGYEIRLYENSADTGQELVLTGPNEAIARSIYARALSCGGIEIELNSFLEIHTHDDWGPPPHSMDDHEVLLPGARLTHLWRFEEERLESVFVRRPGTDLLFGLEAADSSGKRSTATGSYQEQRDRYCQTHDEPELLCR